MGTDEERFITKKTVGKLSLKRTFVNLVGNVAINGNLVNNVAIKHSNKKVI